MAEELDIRWQQRYQHYSDAVDRLGEAIQLMHDPNVAPLARKLMSEGLIQRFEFTQELAWKLMKDYEEYQGYVDIAGSRDAIRLALEMGLITDRAWMDSIRDRNVTSHVYDDETILIVIEKIQMLYAKLFRDFRAVMQSKL